MLTSRIVKQVEIPHEEGEWMRLRMLPGKKLQEAIDEKQRRALLEMKALGGDVIAAIKALNPAEKAEAKASADPITQYDEDTILRAGIIAWSYDDKVTPQAIDDLDETTRGWVVREILALSQADRGNSTAPSTST